MKHLICSLVRVGQKDVTPLAMNGENAKFIFQWEPLDNLQEVQKTLRKRLRNIF